MPESQHMPGQESLERKKYKISFGQIYLSKPMMTESDGETTTLFPHEARLRNLTCARRERHAPLRGCEAVARARTHKREP
jgi:DNA-directed RNA polymerase beta subunit